MKAISDIERKLQQELLLARRVEGDRLMLADSVIHAALSGERPLTPNERAALQASPLTLRRLSQLAKERNAGAATNAPQRWQGSVGMLRAAAGGMLKQLATDDGHWSLHFLPHGRGWQVVLKLAASAPFASWLMCEVASVQVVDGAGATVLEGRLDSDGECEAAWPFALDPAQHFQQHGALFSVKPCATQE